MIYFEAFLMTVALILAARCLESILRLCVRRYGYLFSLRWASIRSWWRHPSTSVTIEDRYLRLCYQYAYNSYELMIPYEHSLVVPMTQLLIELRTADEYRVIHHPPGVPLLVSAEDLGGVNYRITNLETGQTTIHATAPGYDFDAETK